MDMVAGLQGSRMNDQRASLPSFPGLNSGDVINQLLTTSTDRNVPDDSFFDMLMRCQVSGVSVCVVIPILIGLS